MAKLIYKDKEIEIEQNSNKEHIYIRFSTFEDMQAFWEDFEDDGYLEYSIKKGEEVTEAVGIGMIGVLVKYKYTPDQKYLARFDVAQENG